ncbi:MAG: NAD(P)/FAD-dependent oxidoreductase [Caulobacteraceae bacterium]
MREPIKRDVDVVVVGAGFGGLYMAQKLRELGMSMQGFDAAKDVGGTWYWNRYPGARCDIASLYYSYTWSPEVQKEWRWTEKYAAQPELLQYAGFVADKYDLRRDFIFETKVNKAHWDARSGRWMVTTEQGDVVNARFCVMATGCLSVPREPRIPGEHDFKGEVYHTGRWPHEKVDFTGKRVAVIGTGSSAIQSIPQIAKEASQLYVMQRTPNFSVPARNGPLTDKDYQIFWDNYEAFRAMVLAGTEGIAGGGPSKNFTPEQIQERFETLWRIGGAGFLGALADLLTNQTANDIAANFVRSKIREMVKDPATAEALCPDDHPIGAKRICVDIDYYETYNRDNVRLVNLRNEPIEAITASGIKTSAGDYEVDAIVFATGFDAMTGALLNIDICGENHLALKDVWKDGPKSLLGIQVAGFPNLFTLTGPGSPSVLSNMISSNEQHVDWVTGLLAHMKKEGLTRVEARQDSQDRWAEHVNEAAAKTLFPTANSWYMGANIPGKPRVFMPYVGGRYRQKCNDEAAAGYPSFELA